MAIPTISNGQPSLSSKNNPNDLSFYCLFSLPLSPPAWNWFRYFSNQLLRELCKNFLRKIPATSQFYSVAKYIINFQPLHPPLLTISDWRKGFHRPHQFLCSALLFDERHHNHWPRKTTLCIRPSAQHSHWSTSARLSLASLKYVSIIFGDVLPRNPIFSINSELT